MIRPLTDPQRRALTQASRKGGATIAPRFRAVEKGTVAADTATRMVEAGYATLTNNTLTTTPAGHLALARPLPHQPRYLRARGSGYTSVLSQSARDEPEGIPIELETHMAKVNERNRLIGYQRVHDIEAELSTITDAIDRLCARGDLGQHAIKRLTEMRRQRDKLRKDLAA